MSFSVRNPWVWIWLIVYGTAFVVSIVYVSRRWRSLNWRWKIGYLCLPAYVAMSGPVLFESRWHLHLSIMAGLVVMLGYRLTCDEPYPWQHIVDEAFGRVEATYDENN